MIVIKLAIDQTAKGMLLVKPFGYRLRGARNYISGGSAVQVLRILTLVLNYRVPVMRIKHLGLSPSVHQLPIDRMVTDSDVSCAIKMTHGATQVKFNFQYLDLKLYIFII